MRSTTSWASAGLLGISLVACGSTEGPVLSAGPGGDDGGPIFQPGADAGGLAAFDAHVEENHVTVTFVTLSCSGDCATVQAVGTGGYPPYTFKWDDGSTRPTRQVCPTSSTRYSVTVTDTGMSGEFATLAESAKVSLPAKVGACPDGGLVSDAGPVGPCDSLVGSISPTGANPAGAWSYGWSPSLGGTFSLLSNYLSPSTNNGLEGWAQGILISNTVADFNTTASPVPFPGSTASFAPHQFAMGPDDGGEYTVARWIAPASATYVVQASFAALGTQPAGNDVHVLHNGTDVRAGSIASDAGADAVSFAFDVNVAAGDTIDFAVGAAGAMSATSPNQDLYVTLDAAVCTPQ